MLCREVLTTLDEARAWCRHWCLNGYGLRRHSRTQRRPLEHFQAEEQALLLSAPSTLYDIPLWSEPKVGRDQLAAVDKALYSIPHSYVGERVTARADAQLVFASPRPALWRDPVSHCSLRISGSTNTDGCRLEKNAENAPLESLKRRRYRDGLWLRGPAPPMPPALLEVAA